MARINGLEIIETFSKSQDFQDQKKKKQRSSSVDPKFLSRHK